MCVKTCHTPEELPKVNLVAEPWTPQHLLDDLQNLIDEEPDRYMNDRRTILCMARDYLKEYFAQQANEPLTVDELRQMEGEPVWVESLIKPGAGCWMIVYRHFVRNQMDVMIFETYGEKWLAYRRKIEGVNT